MGRFAKGVSGNPRGRPKGVSSTHALRQRLGENLDAVIDKVKEAALGGDMNACRILLDRVLPARRAEEVPVVFAMPDGVSLTQKADSVVSAVADGVISPGQGAQLIQALGGLAKIMETEELVARVEMLENELGKK